MITRPWIRGALVAACLSLLGGCGAVALPASPTASARAALGAPSATPFVRPTIPVLPSPTPVASTLDGFAVRTLALAGDAAPLDVAYAFGSVWTANHHKDTVTRLDPKTMVILATIDVGSGPGWFAVADNALWVTHQNGTGLSRIDPATNSVVRSVGDMPPCGAPVVAFGNLWQSSCDANVIVKIDPVHNVVVDTIPANGHTFLVLAGNRLVSGTSNGLAILDRSGRTFTSIPARSAVGAEYLASDGTTVWAANNDGMARIDPLDGHTVATIPYPDARAVTFAGSHGWITALSEGVAEIDLATNKVIRTIPVQPAPLVALEADGALWVTDMDHSTLWRIDL